MKKIIAKAIIIILVVGVIGLVVYYGFIDVIIQEWEEYGWKSILMVLAAYSFVACVLFTLYNIIKWAINNIDSK